MFYVSFFFMFPSHYKPGFSSHMENERFFLFVALFSLLFEQISSLSFKALGSPTCLTFLFLKLAPLQYHTFSTFTLVFSLSSSLYFPPQRWSIAFHPLGLLLSSCSLRQLALTASHGANEVSYFLSVDTQTSHSEDCVCSETCLFPSYCVLPLPLSGSLLFKAGPL